MACNLKNLTGEMMETKIALTVCGWLKKLQLYSTTFLHCHDLFLENSWQSVWNSHRPKKRHGGLSRMELNILILADLNHFICKQDISNSMNSMWILLWNSKIFKSSQSLENLDPSTLKLYSREPQGSYRVKLPLIPNLACSLYIIFSTVIYASL